MSNQHNLRTKYIPFRPDAIVQANTPTQQPVKQIQKPVQSGQVIGHVFQNVCIGGGMMTQKIPITTQSNSSTNTHRTNSLLSSYSALPPVPVINHSSSVASKPSVSVPVINHSSSVSSSVSVPVIPFSMLHGIPIYQQKSSFVPPVNLVGHSSSSKIVQVPVQKQWASSGTIIIEDAYNRRNGKTCQAIFLGLNPNTGMYELFYGKKDFTDVSESETALRETREESSNMFRFSAHIYNEKYKISSSNNMHHAFIVRVSAPRGGIQSSIFAKNRQVLKANHAPWEWQELSHITRIDISDVIDTGILSHSGGDFTTYDVYGNLITIFSRDAEFISLALRASMHMRGHVNQLSFVSSWDDRKAGGKMMFLNGTSCYRS